MLTVASLVGNDYEQVSILRLPSLASDVVMNYLINQNITVSADGVANNINRKHLCSDNGSSVFNNESLAEFFSEFVCKCAGEFQIF